MGDAIKATAGETVGIDLGDRTSRYCVLGAEGERRDQGKLKSTADGLRSAFEGLSPVRVVIETGTHSPWVDELLSSMGHEVVVANARRVHLISKSQRKSDRSDAELLARLGRVDTELLSPVKHRGKRARTHLELIRARATLVGLRTKLVSHVRGATKSIGVRLAGCSTKVFHVRALEQLTDELEPIVSPLLDTIGDLTARIRDYEKRIDSLCEESYPETALLRQPKGVGPITALCFALTLEDPGRFEKSRQVGAFVGLVPKRRQSGASDPQLRITKAGDRMLRMLLVQCAHHILGPFGEDSDLRRHGERIAAAGGTNARKRAVVAVARKLAVLMHSLWKTGEVYEPLRNSDVVTARAG